MNKQPEALPYGYMSDCGIFQKEKPEIGRWETLYTAPPQRTWVDLTPQDLNDIFKISHTGEGAVYLALKIIKEKNA
jgi:hypothetical protein